MSIVCDHCMLTWCEFDVSRQCPHLIIHNRFQHCCCMTVLHTCVTKMPVSRRKSNERRSPHYFVISVLSNTSCFRACICCGVHFFRQLSARSQKHMTLAEVLSHCRKMSTTMNSVAHVGCALKKPDSGSNLFE